MSEPRSSPVSLRDRTVRVQTPSLEPEARPWCLVVVRGKAIGQRFELGDAATLGREPDSDIYLPEPSISRRHCHIFRKRGGYWVTDLGATNPTAVNGVAIGTSPLLEGDLLTAGDLVLRVLGPRSPENAMVAILHAQAVTDELTGLANRRHFQAMLTRGLDASSGVREQLGLIALDIDHFKRINDRWGHAAGDRVIKAVGAALQTNLTGKDLASRIGGEEFAVLLHQTSAQRALATAEHLHQSLGQLDLVEDGEPVSVAASLGVALARETDTSTDAIYARADAALYEAKRSGRNRVLMAP